MKKPPAHSTHRTVTAVLDRLAWILSWWLLKGSGK